MHDDVHHRAGRTLLVLPGPQRTHGHGHVQAFDLLAVGIQLLSHPRWTDGIVASEVDEHLASRTGGLIAEAWLRCDVNALHLTEG